MIGTEIKRTLWLNASVTALISTSAAALAVPADSDSTGVSRKYVIDEVLVTARKREESMQDVPVSITALGEADIQRRGIADLNDIELNTPSFNYDQLGLKTRPAIRGLGSDNLSPGQDFSTAVFVDGIYQSTGGMAAADAFDIERIEALKGPQGTLWGKNVIGGGINIVPAKPADEFVARASVLIGNYGRRDLEGMINIPTGAVKHRLAVVKRDHNGYSFNANTNTRITDLNKTAFRYSFTANLSDRLIWDFTLDSSSDNQRGRNAVSTGGRGPNPSPHWDLMAQRYGFDTRGDNFTVYGADDGFAIRDMVGLRSEFDMEFDTFTMTVLSAYREIEDSWYDNFTPFNRQQYSDTLIELIDSGALAEDARIRSFGIGDNTKADQWSQEIRFSNAATADRFLWTSGAFYSEEWGEQSFGFQVDSFTALTDLNAAGCAEVINNVCVSESPLMWNSENTSKDYAFFGEVTITLTDDLSLTVGGRYSNNEKDFAGNNRGSVQAQYDVTALGTWSEVTYKANLSYRLRDDLMIYGSYQTGFKPGGYPVLSATAETADVALGEETADAYELGMKGDFFDGNTRLNTSVFYTVFDGLQTVQFNGTDAFFANAEEVLMGGVELEWLQRIGEHVFSEMRYTYLDTQVNGLPGAPDGIPLQRAPKNDVVLNLRYETELSDGSLADIGISGSYRSKSFDDPDANDIEVRPARKLLDAYASWTDASGRYQIKLWGKNLFNQDYPVMTADFDGGGSEILGNPRTFGVTLTLNIQGQNTP
jgi:iron complex outermembrane recepter protein